MDGDRVPGLGLACSGTLIGLVLHANLWGWRGKVRGVVRPWLGLWWLGRLARGGAHCLWAQCHTWPCMRSSPQPHSLPTLCILACRAVTSFSTFARLVDAESSRIAATASTNDRAIVSVELSLSQAVGVQQRGSCGHQYLMRVPENVDWVYGNAFVRHDSKAPQLPSGEAVSKKH